MVSIIIPVYNVEKYIARCLESVLTQTYKDIEVIVVNDATPDKSMDIVEKFAAKDSRIRIVNNPRNMGLMMTRKNGYTVADGDYFTFVDSDDYIPANAVEVLVAKADETGADIVAGNYTGVNSMGQEHLKVVSLPYGESRDGVLRALLECKFEHTMWAKLYKKELFMNHQYVTYDKMTNAEDVCLFYQLAANANLVTCVSLPVYYYMENPNSSTHVQLSHAQAKCIVRANKMRLQSCEFSPELKAYACHFATRVFANLHTHGFRIREVAQMLKEEGLSDYYTISHILRTLSMKDFYKIIKNTIASILK